MVVTLEKAKCSCAPFTGKVTPIAPHNSLKVNTAFVYHPSFPTFLGVASTSLSGKKWSTDGRCCVVITFFKQPPSGGQGRHDHSCAAYAAAKSVMVNLRHCACMHREFLGNHHKPCLAKEPPRDLWCSSTGRQTCFMLATILSPHHCSSSCTNTYQEVNVRFLQHAWRQSIDCWVPSRTAQEFYHIPQSSFIGSTSNKRICRSFVYTLYGTVCLAGHLSRGSTVSYSSKQYLFYGWV